MKGPPAKSALLPNGASVSRRALAVVLVALLASAPAVSAETDASAAAAPGKGSLRGRVLAEDGKTPVVRATVKAIHLDTKEIFDSAPTGSEGGYEVTGLPYGYYDVAVVTEEDRLYLSNRVLNVPPERRVPATFLLSEIKPEEREWWEAEPTRVVAGIGRRPDGVARLDEKDRRGVPFWKTGKGIGILVGSGAGALGLLIAATDDDDDEQDRRASPSQP